MSDRLLRWKEAQPMRTVVPPTRHVTQPRPAQERGKAKLEWATVDGVIFHAAQFVGVDPSDRPEGRCQCCEEAIVWKAGDVVLPHVAHRANSTCAATNPETAEHMNAKAKIAHALTCENVLTIASKCSAGHPGEMPWAVAPWAYVQPEYRLGTRRPDVALLDASRDGLAAIEVLHTHAVDKVKAADFAAAGLPWVEVLSSVALEWDEKSPLSIVAADAVTRAGFDAACRPCAETRARVDQRKADTASEANADKERKQRAFHKAISDAELDRIDAKNRSGRIKDIPRLLKTPPSIEIAIASASDDRGIAAVAAVVMRDGKPPHVCAVDKDYNATMLDWIALDFALGLLEQYCPGRGALIFTSSSALSLGANLYGGDGCYMGWPDSFWQKRVCAAVARTRSLVVPCTLPVTEENAAVSRWLMVVAEAATRKAIASARYAS
jgi:hypothetical protein